MQSSLEKYRARSQHVLEEVLSNNNVPPRLLEAMRYATLTGGKRFRALLVYASGAAVDAPQNRLDAVAAAIECIHSYSLIHDDLPAMDDDDLRRGRATTHIAFDEATAILAGDALQSLAFETINSEVSNLNDHQCRLIIRKLSKCAGQVGMVGGQMLDIEGTGTSSSRSQLEDIHRRKTGALIEAAVLCGALCSDSVNDLDLDNLLIYSKNIGLAYQVIDDILDIESSTEILGKPSGSDTAQNKSTYPALIGLEASKELAQNLYQSAIASAATIGDNSEHLIELAALVVNRNH